MLRITLIESLQWLFDSLQAWFEALTPPICQRLRENFFLGMSSLNQSKGKYNQLDARHVFCFLLQQHGGDTTFPFYNWKKFSYLIKHLMVHSEEKPFSCTQCDYSCKIAGNLKQHLIVHSQEKPYSCEQCNHSSKTVTKLKRRLLVHLCTPFSLKQCNTSLV